MNKAQPIIFSGPMVRAILNGHKSQTRRIVKDKQLIDLRIDKNSTENLLTSPYGNVGEIIWIKETWRVTKEYDNHKPRDLPKDVLIEYQADRNETKEINNGKWRTPLFMCRRFSRLTLIITGIKIENLNNCSEEDAKSEGVESELNYQSVNYLESYKRAWELLHGESSWNRNPLVWVISFNIQQS